MATERIEAEVRKLNPGRDEDHIKSVALDCLSVMRAIAPALVDGGAK